MNQREIFYKHIAQTSPAPLALEIKDAKGIYLYDTEGKSYMDLIAGVSVSNLGHSHIKIIQAIQEQADKYTHTNVYGEYILSSQVQLAKKLTSLLPSQLSSVYFVNSGTETTEASIKLAKRYTGRYELIACKNAYHGSTNGSLSLMGNDDFTKAFRPLLPSTKKIRFGNKEDIACITEKTAAVFIEPVQGEAGIRYTKDNSYWKALRKRCNDTGTLLVFDEIQTGMGRTGTLFAFEQMEVAPDILMLAKSLGGGLPLGAFITSHEIMHVLTHHPALGHITTFGGNPLSCATGLASLTTIADEKLYQNVEKKSALFEQYLSGLSAIKSIRRKGFMIALEFEDRDLNFKIIDACLKKGVIVDWFLFCDTAMRIAPPLIITEDEIHHACQIISTSIKENT
ncbi:MAG: aspartate aminotransferase family protein [Bacteroidales bacterium]|jgi:acetylornithine/N-succinyldiaminopimelate aminotransferase|nr:aspartate aminotransferase family protein [Bacteroidales bacterium]